MAQWDDNHILVTERTGKLYRVNLNSGAITEIIGVPEVYARGQGGLLDIAIDTSNPTHNCSERWLYFTYSKPVAGGAATTLARAQLHGQQLSQWQDLLITTPASRTHKHFGSRIAIRNDKLFFGVGERGHRPNAQDLSNHAGKILRLNLDGTVPTDNPFRTTANAQPEIWSYGHRNPQGLCFDEQGRLWEAEHGPRGGDEINQIQPGANYGWPLVSFGKEYYGPFSVGNGTELPGINGPVKVYIPSIAPGSLLCLPQGRANTTRLLLGALALKHINWVEINEAGEAVAEIRLQEALQQRIRSLLLARNGDLLFATDSGNLYRLPGFSEHSALLVR